MDNLVACAEAIRVGDVETLARLLKEDPTLVTARLSGDGGERTLLHIATDYPGHFPNVRASVEMLIAHGADVEAAFLGRHSERPLHWAASSDDLEALDALLDRHADIEAPGAVIGGGTALADAVAFGCWRAARRLVERGAVTTLWQAAALGLMERVTAYFSRDPEPDAAAVTQAFWCSCHGGELPAAEYLGWLGWPYGSRCRQPQGARELVEWLGKQGARSATSGGETLEA